MDTMENIIEGRRCPRDQLTESPPDSKDIPLVLVLLRVSSIDQAIVVDLV